MILNFCLFKYFPYGGMQRDCLRFAKACNEAGYQVNILTIKWTGDKPKGIKVIEFPQKNFFNYKKYISYNNQILKFISTNYKNLNIPSINIGFNKILGLDIYYAADCCFLAKNQNRSKIIKFTGRYKYFKEMENSIFGEGLNSKTNILFLIDKQLKEYHKIYKTDSSRMHIMPPTIEVIEKIKALNTKNIKSTNNELRFLLIGSGFKTKGLDRILKGLSFLKQSGIKKFKLLVIGNDKSSCFSKQIKKLDLKNNVIFTGGRSDIVEIMQDSDLLLHPAYNENTGKVLIEAVASGLPVICSDSCGYAKYIKEAKAGLVMENFDQNDFNKSLYQLATDHQKRMEFSKNGKSFGKNFQKDSDVKKLLQLISTY